MVKSFFHLLFARRIEGTLSTAQRYVLVFNCILVLAALTANSSFAAVAEDEKIHKNFLHYLTNPFETPSVVNRREKLINIGEHFREFSLLHSNDKNFSEFKYILTEDFFSSLLAATEDYLHNEPSPELRAGALRVLTSLALFVQLSYESDINRNLKSMLAPGSKLSQYTTEATTNIMSLVNFFEDINKKDPSREVKDATEELWDLILLTQKQLLRELGTIKSDRTHHTISLAPMVLIMLFKIQGEGSTILQQNRERIYEYAIESQISVLRYRYISESADSSDFQTSYSTHQVILESLAALLLELFENCEKMLLKTNR